MGLLDFVLDIIIDILVKNIFDAEYSGKYGEKLTEKELMKANKHGFKGLVLRNLYVPKDDGTTSEIDVVFICSKGIIVIESKNYSGWIFGNEYDAKWTASLPNGTKNRFYNPIRQNYNHIKWLKSFIAPDFGDVNMVSLIAFSERCTLKKVTVNTPDVYVVNRDMVRTVLKDVWKNKEDCLTSDQIDALYEKLKPLTEVDEATKQAHINNIKVTNAISGELFGNTKMPSMEELVAKELGLNLNMGVNPQNDSRRICPRCGSPLVLRTAKRGVNVGNQFYGCSAFPRCRYIENL